MRGEIALRKLGMEIEKMGRWIKIKSIGEGKMLMETPAEYFSGRPIFYYTTDAIVVRDTDGSCEKIQKGNIYSIEEFQKIVLTMARANQRYNKLNNWFTKLTRRIS